jgi:aminoglycoside phosphotransferase (APT) family kinase protein
MGNNLLDRPTPVRAGEELDREILTDYLKQQLPDLEGDLSVEQFPSGYSNLTYLLRIGSRQIVLRRPPFGAQIKTAHDMSREFTILSRLVAVYPKVPTPLHYCADKSILGTTFYVMTRVEGVILRPQMPEALIPSANQMAQIADSFIDNLVKLHNIDHVACGLNDLGKPEGYIARQIHGWTRRYQNARSEDIAEIEAVSSWLVENIPGESGATLIHNDYKYDNLVLDPEELSHILAVLDWEMATIGDPLMDLGTTLGYWVEASDPDEIKALRLSPTDLPGNPSRTELVERYFRHSGRSADNIVFYYVYGLFKLAVIVQQIYSRYLSGHTKDPRFANLIYAVRACGKMAAAAIEKNRIDRLLT